MEYVQLLDDIEKAKSGNELIRQEIINSHKPFIINVVSHISKRYISWSDEEASIGLIAFNKAIDAYNADKGREFLSFSYLLIKRDLVSYFRSNSKYSNHLSMDMTNEEMQTTAYEIETSIQDYQKAVYNEELVGEILELNTALEEYGIKFEELERFCPKHKDTRAMIDSLVSVFTKDTELVHEMTRKKRFPSTAFLRRYGYPHKTIERFHKYIITLIIISLHTEWVHLSAYIGIGNDGRERAHA